MNCPKCGAGRWEYRHPDGSVAVVYDCDSTDCHPTGFIQSLECKLTERAVKAESERDALAAKVATLEGRVSELTDERDTSEAGRVALFKRCEELGSRVKRLEEAGDRMVAHAKDLGMDGTGLVKQWTQAKDAK